MPKVSISPECWNCGNIVSDDHICPKCGEHQEDDPEQEEQSHDCCNTNMCSGNSSLDAG